MAFSEVSLTGWPDVPAQMAIFANAQGWDTTLNSGVATLARPVSADPLVSDDADIGTANRMTWTLTAILNGARNHLRVTGDRMDPVGDEIIMAGPRYNGTELFPVQPLPTKLYCFGEGHPRPWLAFAVEFGFNNFRLAYFGTLDRIGSYLGGDCCAVTNYAAENRDTAFPQTAWIHTGNLFRAVIDAPTWDEPNGDFVKRAGVYVGNDMDGSRWRQFHVPPSASGSVFRSNRTAKMAFGGWGDGVDDCLLSNGFAGYSGEQLIFPINLFTLLGSGSTALVRPLGAVRGVRNVNLRNLDPGDRITVGNQNWRVFPTARKSAVEKVPQGPTSGSFAWPAQESSLYCGIAMLEGPA